MPHLFQKISDLATVIIITSEGFITLAQKDKNAHASVDWDLRFERIKNGFWTCEVMPLACFHTGSGVSNIDIIAVIRISKWHPFLHLN